MKELKFRNELQYISNNIVIVEGPLQEIKKNIADKKKVLLVGNRGSGLSTTLSYLSKKEESLVVQVGPVFHKPYETKYYDEFLKAIIFQSLYTKIKGIDEEKSKSFAIGASKAGYLVDRFGNLSNSDKDTISESEMKNCFNIDPVNVVKDVKQKFDLKNLTLMIDRFDWILGSNPQLQKEIIPYFEIFDKTILTINDSEVLKQEKKQQLENKGFYIQQLKYSKDYNVFLNIMDAYIDTFHKKKNATAIKTLKNMDEEDKKWLFNQYNGDIKCLFLILEKYVSYEIEKKRTNFPKAIDLAYSDIMRSLNNPFGGELMAMKTGESIPYNKKFTFHL